MMKIYLDYQATTPIDPRVKKFLVKSLNEDFANPSSSHQAGLTVRRKILNARNLVAKSINADVNEIIFTSGTTESINIALKSFCSFTSEKSHIISTNIEHKVVLNVLNKLEQNGFQISLINVKNNGIIDLEELKRKITKKTFLISIIHANNEIGVVQPIEEIGQICKNNEIVFCVDAAQSFTKIPIDVKKMHIDFLAFSSHKIYGPKGVGGLYFNRKKVFKNMVPLFNGGGQEFGLRSGTLNTVGILGFAKAVEVAMKVQFRENKHLKELREYILLRLRKSKLNFIENGDPLQRLQGNINLYFEGIESEYIINSLDSAGISISSGSACQSDSLEPSHVIFALYQNENIAKSSIRISLGRFTTIEDVDVFLRKIIKVIRILKNS